MQRFTRGRGKDELVWKLFSRTQIRGMHGICYLCASPRFSSALNARTFSLDRVPARDPARQVGRRSCSSEG